MNMLLNLVSTNAGWLARQAIKYSAVGAAIITAWLVGHGFDTAHAGVIAGGVSAIILGGIEAGLSFIARKYAVPDLDAVSVAIEAAKKAPVIIAALLLTSCAGFVDVVGNFLGSPTGQVVMAAISAQAKQLENTWEAEKIPPLIDKSRAAIAKLPAKTGNAIKDLPRDMQEKAWIEFISLAQTRYKALTGGKYVTPVAP
ncbi:hypothetical protein [Prosthecobacter sp.]|jgi:hypothetical protein|uniref:hypothetical protein n=1 Tax=Prosthecobacter sp. TaxID=1965333 RepID=UPI0037C7DB70